MKYAVEVFCDECGQPHRAGIIIELDEVLPDRTTVNDSYAGKPLPPELAMINNNQFRCPTTKNFYTQKDNDQVYLVAVGD